MTKDSMLANKYEHATRPPLENAPEIPFHRRAAGAKPGLGEGKIVTHSAQTRFGKWEFDKMECMDGLGRFRDRPHW